tara:strand:+ start:2877 stop:3059 length:183 start_codon:yes stop_codon:yes gene_type:complete
MGIIIAIVIGLIVSIPAGIFLNKSRTHQHSKKPKLGSILNGVISAMIFFCVALLVYTALS